MPQECRGCKGTGKLPPIVHEDGSVTPAADCIQCDGAGNQETIEDISARVAQDEQWREGIETGEPMDIAWQLLKYDFYYDKKRRHKRQGVHYPPSRLDFTPIKGQEHPALQESGKNKRIDPTTRLTGGERPGHYVGVNIANLNPHPSMQEGQAFDQTAQMLGRNLTHEGVHSLIEDEVREAATTPQQYTNMTEWGAHQAMFPGGQDQADLANRLYASHPHTTNVTTGEPMNLAWRLLKYEEGAKWFAPNTFDADSLRRYNRYLMDNYFDKLPEEARKEVGGLMFFIEQEEQALRAGDESYMGLMTPEYAIGNINAILQEHGLITQDMGEV